MQHVEAGPAHGLKPAGDTTPRHPFTTAFLAGDMDAVAATLADDVELDSPVIRTRFRGKEEVMGLLSQVWHALDDKSFSDEVAAGSIVVLAFRARARDQPIQGAHVLRLDDDGLIREFTVQMRPLAGLAAFAAEIGPRVARRSRLRRLLVAWMTRPVAWATAFGDPIASRLAIGRSDR